MKKMKAKVRAKKIWKMRRKEWECRKKGWMGEMKKDEDIVIKEITINQNKDLTFKNLYMERTSCFLPFFANFCFFRGLWFISLQGVNHFQGCSRCLRCLQSSGVFIVSVLVSWKYDSLLCFLCECLSKFHFSWYKFFFLWIICWAEFYIIGRLNTFCWSSIDNIYSGWFYFIRWRMVFDIDSIYISVAKHWLKACFSVGLEYCWFKLIKKIFLVFFSAHNIIHTKGREIERKIREWEYLYAYMYVDRDKRMKRKEEKVKVEEKRKHIKRCF